MTAADGPVAQSYTYDSFGNQTASSGSLTNFFRYTGREFDTETNLYYYRARYYDPTAGRFLSEDRLHSQGGNNFYRYAQNSPLLWIDPSGNDQCYSVTPNGMSEKPCVDPNHGMNCSNVPGGVSCNVPIPPGPPAAPPPPSDPNAPSCPCNPLSLFVQSQQILNEQEGNDLHTVGWAGGSTGMLQGLEQGFAYLRAGGLSEWLPILDLALLGHDAYDAWKNERQTEERLKKLLAP